MLKKIRNIIEILKTFETNGTDTILYCEFFEKCSLSEEELKSHLKYLVNMEVVGIEACLSDSEEKKVVLKSRGEYLCQEIFSDRKNNPGDLRQSGLLPPEIVPIGSPYGFTSNDWKFVIQNKRDIKTLYTVVGLQYETEIYNCSRFLFNLEKHVLRALKFFNRSHKREINLNFRKLEAGLGEHQFNKIVRDIIGADIAFFETSDLNPNVMMEIGVALTWGVNFIPLKERSQSKPPSDISGHTWVDYEHSAEKICDSGFTEKLTGMFKRVIQNKKARLEV